MRVDIRNVDILQDEITLLRQQNADLRQKLVALQENHEFALNQLQQAVGDRQQIEGALQSREAEIQALFRAMQDVILVFDAKGKYLNVIPTSAPFIYRTPSELLGKTIQDVFPPEHSDYFLKTIRQVLKTGKPVKVEYLLPHEDQEIWLEAHIAPLGEDRVVWVAKDNTERKRTEEELKRSEARFRSYFELPLIGIAITSPEKGWVAVNDKVCEMLGYAREELVQLTWSELTHPDDLVLDLEFFQQMLAGQIEQYAMEKRYFRKDGVMIYASLAVGCTRKPDGSVDYVAALMQDITDRKLAEVALRESEQQLREQADRETLLNRLLRKIRSSLDFNAVLLTTLQEIQNFLQIESCHFAWCFPNADPPYWEVIEDLHASGFPGLRGEHSAVLENALFTQWLNQEGVQIADITTIADENLRQFFRDTGIQSFIGIFLQLSPDRFASLICSHTQVRQWSGEEIELLKVVMEQLAIAFNQADLYTQARTKAEELERTLEELQRTQAKMVQSEKMSSLGQLVAGVAHEINNPVNFIAGNLTHAREYTSDLLHLMHLYQQHYPEPVAEIQEAIEAVDLDFLLEDLPKILASMGVGADRIRQIVLSLRNFSRMDEAEQKEVNIHEGIDSTLMILQNRLKTKGNQPDIQVIKEYGKLPLVDCYPGQLNQVFMNVLVNAIDVLESDASPSPEIQICTELLADDHILIKIADNGSGIPPEVQSRLFDPFFTTKPVGKGTGLGLSISYQIVVEKHRGQLSCFSTPGQGTEFHIKIPTHQSPRSA
ncbi:MAG: PAS domain S-box protein [Synechococcales bacterium]|nr:PAS domain S-box protein [Synechococcales bacterium]